MLNQKKEESKLTKTHFGPEETEELILETENKIKEQKAFLNRELRKQIEVNITYYLRREIGEIL